MNLIQSLSKQEKINRALLEKMKEMKARIDQIEALLNNTFERSDDYKEAD